MLSLCTIYATCCICAQLRKDTVLQLFQVTALCQQYNSQEGTATLSLTDPQGKRDFGLFRMFARNCRIPLISNYRIEYLPWAYNNICIDVSILYQINIRPEQVAKKSLVDQTDLSSKAYSIRITIEKTFYQRACQFQAFLRVDQGLFRK